MGNKKHIIILDLKWLDGNDYYHDDDDDDDDDDENEDGYGFGDGDADGDGDGDGNDEGDDDDGDDDDDDSDGDDGDDDDDDDDDDSDGDDGDDGDDDDDDDGNDGDDDDDDDDDDDNSDDIVDVEKERDILEELQPHRNLRELSIDGYRGEIFPDWLGFSCFSNMTKLSLRSCKNCRQLPSLGQLPSMKHLEIWRLDGLERIGGEVYNNAESSHQGTPFRSLESLIFNGMPRWREWHIPHDFDGFPKLKTLSILKCPVLSGDLPAHLPALEELMIWKCEELACSLPRAPKLQQLIVIGSGLHRALEHGEIVISKTQQAKSVLEGLLHIQSPPCLQRLKIHKCSSAISISGDYLPDSLQFLKIWGCSNLTISEPLQHKSLTEIIVFGCDSLTMFPLGPLPNLKTLYISDCPEMDCFGEECLPPSLTTLRIRRCQKLERWITSKGLQSQGLTHLILSFWKKVKRFPRKGCLPASLKFLKLSYFSNLEMLDCKGLHHLTSLKQLTIEECPKLENITQQNLPASISKLRIYGKCPLRGKLEEMNDPRIQFQRDLRRFLGF